ncbi:MAG: hypothetical protein L6W00_27355 [Lentisphaeria bacterium]|nr:MAG: hypothetical protein L6W00_27355 [Lentisphaeria bacterium]
MAVTLSSRIGKADGNPAVAAAHGEREFFRIDRFFEAMDCRGVIAMSAGVNLQLKFPAVGFQFRISSRSEFSSSIQRPEPGYGWNRDPARRSIYFNSLQVGKTNSAIFSLADRHGEPRCRSA